MAGLRALFQRGVVRPCMLVHAFKGPRNYTRAFSLIATFLLFAGVAQAATAPGTIISNTGQVSYNIGASPVRTTNNSNTVKHTVLVPNSATIVAAFTPNSVFDSYSSVAVTTITNTGGGVLQNGVISITPPAAGVVFNVPNDPYGTAYTSALVAGNWQVTLTNPLAIAASIDIYANALVPAGTAATTVNMGATFQATSLAPIAATAPLIITNIRTQGVISFLQPDTAGVLQPASVYHVGNLIYVQVDDNDQNKNPLVAETVVAVLTDSITGDSETIVLTETGPNTGIFQGNVPSTAAPATANDGIYSAAQGSKITGTYTDQFDLVASVSSAALVDPFGVLFDSTTGAPVAGASVSLLNCPTPVTCVPATVFDIDGVTPFPSTLISDAQGNYRFPFIAPGNYQLQVVPPAGYSFVSQVTPANLGANPLTSSFVVFSPHSYGQTFVINPGPAIHIDIPLDPKATGLFVTKTVSKQSAAIGDAVPYVLNIENTSAANNVTATSVVDTLPLGFRYKAGTARLAGAVMPDPIIASNGRTLTFNIGVIPAASIQNLSYIAIVGANTLVGIATNAAVANGTQLATVITSNVARARLVIYEDLIASKSFLAGSVFVDAGSGGDSLADSGSITSDAVSANASALEASKKTGNGIIDKGEEGLANIRIFLEDGTFTMTDKDGNYHFEGIDPGTHIVQVDTSSLPAGYELVGLKNTRFAGSNFSQFVDVKGGTIWRTNFRVVRKALRSTPVKVEQVLQQNGDDYLVALTIRHQGTINLQTLSANYILPAGWSYQAGSATLADQASEPETSITGLQWKLDPGLTEQHISFRIRSDGTIGNKQGIAYARFAASGTKNGRTSMAVNHINDEVTETYEAQQIILHLGFGTRKAMLTGAMKIELNQKFKQLAELKISSLKVLGYTDHIAIAANHRQEFANNKILALARASSVANYLSKRLGLSDDQVRVQGMGAANPIASNSTAKGRAENRRVVIEIQADKVIRESTINIVDKQSKAAGMAKQSWDKPTSKIQKYANETSSKTLKEWLLLAQPETAWLYPGDSDVPAISATHIYIQHKPEQKVELLLEGQKISPLYFEGIKKNASKTAAISYWRGVSIKEGDNHFVAHVIDRDGNVIKTIEQVVHYSSPPVRAVLLPEQSDLVANGQRSPIIQVQLFDKTGSPAREGIIGEFTVDQPHQSLEDYKNASLAGYTPLPSHFRTGKNGIASIKLMPSTQTGDATIRLKLSSGEQIIKAWLKPELRDWIMVGFGEGTLGYNKLSGAIQPITNPSEKDKYYQDGRVAFYGKGRVKGDFLLTLAYDTAKTQGKVGNSLNQTINPNSYYTIYGDASQQLYDASSQRKLYVKLEKESFYALFGDFDTGLTVTELARYSRGLNGFRSEYRGDTFSYNAFATQTNQSLVKDEIRGNGTSGLYRLSRTKITINSERVFVETRDRFKSEIILNSQELMQFVDYNIDYLAGTLYFKQPVMSKDAALNPIYIRVEYESGDNNGQQQTTFGGRAAVKVNADVEVGSTYIQQGQVGVDDRLIGVDTHIKLGEKNTVIAEVAQSRSQAVTASRAYKAEIRHTGETVQGSAYIRQVDDNFGLGQVIGSENATRKYGATASMQVGEKSTVNADGFHQSYLNTGSKRDSATLTASHNFEEATVNAGLLTARDTDGAGKKVASNQLTAGASTNLTERLSLRTDHAQNIGSSNSVDYPTRTSVGADYRITNDTSLFVTQEWTHGQTQASNSSRVGVRTQPWNGAELSTSYEQQLGESGTNSFANIGLQQMWHATETLDLSAGLDRSQTIKHPGTTSLNPNVPLASGGGLDFTAISIGATYRPESYIWNNRAEYRVATDNQHWGLDASIQGDIDENLTSNAILQILRNQQVNASDTAVKTSLGAAYRPNTDGLILIDRLDINYSNIKAVGSRIVNWHYINNMTANWQSRSDVQFAFNYSAKWANDRINDISITGFTDLLGMQGVWDINENWDVSMQAAMLHTWATGQYTPSYGVGVGHTLYENLWASVGYNFVGFQDRDFAASEYTRQGVYMRFRFKFDQKNMAGLLENMQ